MWLLVFMLCLLVDVIVFLRVDICESTMGEYIKYSASPNLRGCGEVDGECYLVEAGYDGGGGNGKVV